MRSALRHPLTCILIGMALGYVLTPQIGRIPVVKKLPQV